MWRAELRFRVKSEFEYILYPLTVESACLLISAPALNYMHLSQIRQREDPFIDYAPLFPFSSPGFKLTARETQSVKDPVSSRNPWREERATIVTSHRHGVACE